VYELGFVNAYGTEITAARELEVLSRTNEMLLRNILPDSIVR